MSTQQYTRPSDIYEGEAGLANRTKYQTASSATPPEAVSSTKVDGDINYLIDAVNELFDTAVSGTVPDNSITNAKLSAGTDGALRSYDTNGDPADISPGTSLYPLVSAGAGAVPTYSQLTSTGIATAAITNGKLDASAMLSFNTIDGSTTTDYITITDTSDSGNAKRELISDFYTNSLSSLVDTSAGALDVVKQVQYNSNTSVVTCSTNIPNNNSIPQNTEGDEVVTVSITPQSTSSTLQIEAFVSGGNSANTNYVTIAVFQDSDADAIAAACFNGSGNENPGQGLVYHQMTSGTTSATTFRVRVGTHSGTFYVNGDDSGNRLLGGVQKAWIKVTEIA